MSAPQRFRKKPVEIEAMQWTPSDEVSAALREWAEPAVAIVDTDHIQHLWDYDAGCYILPSGKTVFAPYRERCLIVLTLEGEMVATPGDWVIRGVQGEFYPCKPDIFTETYEASSVPAVSVQTYADADPKVITAAVEVRVLAEGEPFDGPLLGTVAVVAPPEHVDEARRVITEALRGKVGYAE